MPRLLVLSLKIESDIHCLISLLGEEGLSAAAQSVSRFLYYNSNRKS